ncbi:acetyl-CoA carboxylase carboxyltransferase subunit alpha [Streptomyces gobiensis]|uniref:acetyl-CoA carboxylase carboxyltransferase subunit alpha n=1 Tax=Streptomyces gobiensis TaxID=2875706 RepID=UPI001E3536B8|nr:acetyl-CoA carboxylase carboxyltransferase subunit alpha [Streptomyces gobiensis]UGY94212.1 acetyl-CoA carboxylase carboxyltransferase subunit alpha [Streptomyces gobiensis]
MSMHKDPGTVAVSPRTLAERLDDVPASTWTSCPQCQLPLYGPKLERMLRVCPGCGHHLRLSAVQRLDAITDVGTFAELDGGLRSSDPLAFHDSTPYPARLERMRERTGRPDAALYGTAAIGGRRVALCLLDFAFMGGSMGSVVGEKVARAAELAAEEGMPLVTCSSSGGARMQEGILSLLQMAKTTAALRRLSTAGQPHISVLTDPVYGGVSASFASYADVILAEPGVRAGFAGPRVIEQTIRQKLPDGFQTAGFLLRNGHIDAIVPRAELHGVLARIVDFHAAPRVRNPAPATAEDDAGRRDGGEPPKGPEGPVDAWQAVQLARHPDRPRADEYIEAVFDDFVELRGDRMTEDDPAILGGLARLDGIATVVIAHRKGRGTAEAVACNFGMPHPSGYRKARRLMEYAERTGVPLVTLVDTPGAYPGIRAEEGNQSAAIADNLAVLSQLRVPVVSAITGEGGSGGALALCVSDHLMMLQHATLSVISPEGCASILFNDAGQAPRAANALRLTARDLMRLGVADEVVPEPAGGAHTDPEGASRRLRRALRHQLGRLADASMDECLQQRYLRLRAVGSMVER